MLPELILMFKSLGSFAFKLDVSSVQQRESCVCQAEYWNMLLGIKLLNLLNLQDLPGLSGVGQHAVIFKSLSHSITKANTISNDRYEGKHHRGRQALARLHSHGPLEKCPQTTRSLQKWR